MSIVTLSEQKTYIKITSSTYDSLLTQIITSVEGVVNNFCDRQFAQTTYYQLYDGNGKRDLMLDNSPIISVAVLSQDLDLDNSEYDSKMASTDFFINKKAGIIELYGGVFSKGQRNTYVEYSAGYATANMPDDVKMAVLDMVTKKFLDIEEKRMGVTQKNAMGENISFEFKDMPDMHRATLKRHINYGELKGIDVSQFGEG